MAYVAYVAYWTYFFTLNFFFWYSDAESNRIRVFLSEGAVIELCYAPQAFLYLTLLFKEQELP
jgi:hypothetical protein